MLETLTERGHPCLALYSSPTPDLYAQVTPGCAVEELHHDGNMATTVNALARRGPSALIPGCDLGVELADELAETLGLPCNQPGLRAARRNKGLAGAALRAAGLASPDQLWARSAEEALAWQSGRGLWPVVIKPVASTASDSVALCSDASELAGAFAEIAGALNVLGQCNEGALVQELVEGDEYVVDTVSWDSQRRLAAIWRYHKEPAIPGQLARYTALELLADDGEIQRELLPYARAALDALGLRFGPAHSEIMLTADGPTLIELNARLSGGSNAVIAALSGGTSALELTIEAYRSPERFLAGVDLGYRLERHAVNRFLMSGQEGELSAVHGIEELRRRPSFHALELDATIGKPLRPVMGVVTLLHPRREVIERDLEWIKELELGRLFEVAVS